MDLYQIMQTFQTEQSVYDYFERTRWNKKRVCPHCQIEHNGNRYENLQYHCGKCRKRFSVLTNTYLHNTRIPLQKWLFAFAVVSDAKKGLSAHQLKRNIGVHYETAFNMSHKIRDIMAEEKIEKLEELTEMDETFIGGKPRKPNLKNPLSSEDIKGFEKGLKTIKDAELKLKRGRGNPAKIDVDIKRGRGSQKQTPVVGIVERDGAVIAEVMKVLSAANLKNMVEKYVQTDNSILITDTYKGYNKLHNIIEHIKIDHSKLYSYKGINTNTIESFWAVVERGIMGQYHHVTLKYLPKYVVEFVFKFNNRKFDDMFDTLVKASMGLSIPRPVMKSPKIRKKVIVKSSKLPF